MIRRSRRPTALCPLLSSFCRRATSSSSLSANGVSSQNTAPSARTKRRGERTRCSHSTDDGRPRVTMVSLWGSKNGGDQTRSGSITPADTEQGDSGYSGQRHSREADERTRLIPPRRPGYLEPDDPAVSPFPPLSPPLSPYAYGRQLTESRCPPTTSGPFGS